MEIESELKVLVRAVHRSQVNRADIDIKESITDESFKFGILIS